MNFFILLKLILTNLNWRKRKTDKHRTLHTAFEAHGFFKHAFLHLSSEQNWLFSQSASFKQLLFTAPEISNTKPNNKIINKYISLCLIIFQSIQAQLMLANLILNYGFCAFLLTTDLKNLPLKFQIWRCFSPSLLYTFYDVNVWPQIAVFPLECKSN